MTAQSIVVGVDGSPESASAASVAWMLARAADVQCRLVHATDDVNTSLAMAGTGVVTEALQLAALAGARAELGASLKDCVPSYVVDAMVVSTGAPADVLDRDEQRRLDPRGSEAGLRKTLVGARDDCPRQPTPLEQRK